MRIADMRHVVADDRPRHSGGGCTLCKQDAAAGGRGESYGPEPAVVTAPYQTQPLSEARKLG
jgi:hypothetical protein